MVAPQWHCSPGSGPRSLSPTSPSPHRGCVTQVVSFTSEMSGPSLHLGWGQSRQEGREGDSGQSGQHSPLASPSLGQSGQICPRKSFRTQPCQSWGIDHPSSFTYCGSSLECSSLHPIYCSFNKQGFRFLFSHNKQSAGTWFWHDFSCSAKLSQTPALSAHLLSFIFPGPVEAYSSHLRACHFPVARWLL